MIARFSPVGGAMVLLATAAPALAHHGSAAISAFGAEGPGAALDTASPLPLGIGTAFALAKSEYAAFQQREGFVDQKRYSSFNTLALGFGLRPWLSAFAFQPFSVKSQLGAGTNSGLGDTNLMLSTSFKWDEGFKRVPEKESLDELADWHFGAWASCTLPVGATAHRGAAGLYFAPDMQTGFGGPSPGLGLTAMKQFGTDLTMLFELNYQHFFDQNYKDAGYRYRFGGEARLNAAVVWRTWAAGTKRVDLLAELSGLNLQRDRTDEGTGLLAPMQASGGSVLYGQLGARATFGSLSWGLGVKRPLAKRLNEGNEQQGSEGLESFRATLVVGYATRL